jgi:uncharacterized protein YqjF (DUF2071 family)
MSDQALHPITHAAPALATHAIMQQHWGTASFLHWRVPAETVAPLLPAGTRPDLFDGTTWVGLIAFRLSRFAILPGPPLPYIGTFPEINVRLYSTDAAGRRGVVFRSLEASRLLTVVGANVSLNVSYKWARMSIDELPDAVTYRSRRLTGQHPESTIVTRPLPEVVEGDALADFLTARWGMHTRVFGETRFLPNEHEPWPLQRAELVSLDDELLAAGGLPGVASRPPDSVLYSAGVTTRFGLPLPR